MQAIYNSGGEISLAITLKDDIAKKKSGRIYLDKFCGDRRIPLLKVGNINETIVLNKIRSARLDWLFIIGWSQIAQTNLLRSTKYGVIGAHPTLLPIGRGRAAIPWAILKGLDRTGVTLFKMDDGIDTGPILKQKVIEICVSETATTLYKKVEMAHIEVIKDFIPEFLNHDICLHQQCEDYATIWPGRKPEDGEINLKGSVMEAEVLIRAVTHPYPGAFFIKENKKIIVWNAQIVDRELLGAFFLEFYDGYLNILDYEVKSLEV